MRTILILILLLLLCTAAFITRPGKREFVLHLLDAPDGHAAPWSADAVQHANRVAKSVTFKNHWLWVDVEQDGKVLYTGLFAHWVPRGEKLQGTVPDAGQMVKMVAALK